MERKWYQMSELEKYVVFHVDGGIGKNIQATAVAEAIAKHHKDRRLIVVASWCEPWLGNPNVWRYYHSGTTPYFHEDFIQNKDTVVYRSEPYFSTGYFEKQKSLQHTWCDALQIPIGNCKSSLHFNQLEREEAGVYMTQNFKKPVMMIQSCGGGVVNHGFPFSWFRDMPANIAQKVVDHFSTQYSVVQLRYKDQPQLQNTFSPDLSLRKVMALIPYSTKRLFIDSFAQHIAGALRIPSVVCWVGNHPEVFGYPIHTNIKTKINLNKYCNYEGYLEPFALQGENYSCPAEYNTETVFDVNEIIAAVEAQQ